MNINRELAITVFTTTRPHDRSCTNRSFKVFGGNISGARGTEFRLNWSGTAYTEFHRGQVANCSGPSANITWERSRYSPWSLI